MAARKNITKSIEREAWEVRSVRPYTSWVSVRKVDWRRSIVGLVDRQHPIADLLAEVVRQEVLSETRRKTRRCFDPLACKTARSGWDDKIFCTFANMIEITVRGHKVRIRRTMLHPGTSVENEAAGEYYSGSYRNYERSEMRPYLWLTFFNLHSAQQIAGVWTFFERDGSAFWLEDGRGNSAKLIRGFIIDSTHIVAQTKAQALRKYAIARKKQEKAELRAAQKKAGKLFWITFDDSLRAGNCEVGTLQFCKRHDIDPEAIGAIRSDWMFEMEDSIWTRRAYGAATHIAE